MQSAPAVIENSMCVPVAIASAFPRICNALLSAHKCWSGVAGQMSAVRRMSKVSVMYEQSSIM